MVQKVDLDIYREYERAINTKKCYVLKGDSPMVGHHMYKYQVTGIKYSPDISDYEVIVKCYEDTNMYDIITLGVQDFLENYEIF